VRPLVKENPMFKTLEAKWNSHTPVYLHNGTKENLIFQLALTVVFLGAMAAYDEYENRRYFPSYYEHKKNRKTS
jgi:hypothetical protein